VSKQPEPEVEVDVEVVPDEEIILDESEGGEPGGTRRIRVYDRARGDFELEIPSESGVTFGYFNPATPKYDSSRGDPYRNRPSDVAAATALRIYRGTTSKSSQLACFLDVQGFRDLSLKLTRLRQRVVIESNFEDDGDGNRNWARDERRQLNKAIEDDEIPF
jgi:hypothetical protein